MNNLIIYIEVYKERPFNFGNVVLTHLQKNKSTTPLLDLDNFSSPDLFNHSIDACKKHAHIKLIINQKEKPTSSILLINFINKLLRIKKIKIDSYLLGDSEVLEKMLRKTNKLTICDEDEFIQKISLTK